jgi:putative thioredoxin
VHIDVTDATFQSDVLERSQQAPVVIDFWAPWCGPCLTLGPILDKVIDATGGRAVLAKVNIDQNPALAKAFDIQSIPVVHVAIGGQIIEGFMGALPEHVVTEFVDKVIALAAEHGVGGVMADEDETSGLIVEAEQPKAAEAPAPAAPPTDDYDRELEGLLPSVRADEVAKARFLEILEAMGTDDPRTAGWRRRLTAQLF